ncbi:MAG: hypothetical protein H6828_05675 [Planctomycetes bacterium]|nr:hypothetical protein [Planctomycetota bacterium]
MEIKQIEVECPCCAARLEIDVLTAKVLRAAAAAELGEDGKPVVDPGRWDRAAERVAGRADAAHDKLEAALDAERTKESRFDDLFERAKKKVQDRSDRDLDA